MTVHIAARSEPVGTALTPPIALHDGAVVDVRPLEPDDREGLAAAFAGLSPYTRYLRFAGPKPELSKRELDFLVDVDHHSREAILAVESATGRWVGLVRYVEFAGEPGVVDVAATVTDDWQGRGLGRALLERLIVRAREEGHRALRASVLASNRRAIAMLRRTGFTVSSSSGVLHEYGQGLV
jgi:GNAT superfamily N-acetyltransferase